MMMMEDEESQPKPDEDGGQGGKDEAIAELKVHVLGQRLALQHESLCFFPFFGGGLASSEPRGRQKRRQGSCG